MLADSRPVAFVGVSDLDAAAGFYGGLLGLALADARPFALVSDGAGCQVRITAVPEVRPAGYTVLGWTVTDLDTEVDRLDAAGVTFLRYDGMEQDGRGIWSAPGGTRVAWFLDPDGNTLSLQGR